MRETRSTSGRRRTSILISRIRRRETPPDVADLTASVEESLVKDERMLAIRRHVMALPERQRTAVLMHKYQGLDYKQIGEVLKLSESATKSLLFRAYQTLRERLKDFVQES